MPASPDSKDWCENQLWLLYATHVRTCKSNKEFIPSACHAYHISVLFHTHSPRDLLQDFLLKGLQSPLHISYTKYSYPCWNTGSSDRTFIHWVNTIAFIGELSVLGTWNMKASFQIWPGYWADQLLEILVPLSRGIPRGLVFQISQELYPPIKHLLNRSKEVRQYWLLFTRAGENALALGQ